jgi:hypothetical protein
MFLGYRSAPMTLEMHGQMHPYTYLAGLGVELAQVQSSHSLLEAAHQAPRAECSFFARADSDVTKFTKATVAPNQQCFNLPGPPRIIATC